jgi:hypothetical protein
MHKCHSCLLVFPSLMRLKSRSRRSTKHKRGGRSGRCRQHRLIGMSGSTGGDLGRMKLTPAAFTAPAIGFRRVDFADSVQPNLQLNGTSGPSGVCRLRFPNPLLISGFLVSPYVRLGPGGLFIYKKKTSRERSAEKSDYNCGEEGKRKICAGHCCKQLVDGLICKSSLSPG